MIDDMTPTPECYDEALHLVFDTEAEALVAEHQISTDMGFTGDVTARWDIPRQCGDGRWIIARPPHMLVDVAEGPA